MAKQIDPSGVEPQTVLAAADFSGARVLEVGSGNGRLSFRLAESARWLVGVDLKHEELTSAKLHSAESLRPGVRFVCASAISLPFGNARFDIAVLTSAL